MTELRKHEKISYLIDHLLASGIHHDETVVVCGFWRSGTTWLLESVAKLLKAKTVFEPDHPRVGIVKQLYSDSQLPAKCLKHYMPYCGASTLDGPLRDFFDNTLVADIPGKTIRLSRKNLLESFHRRVVVKFVRAQLCLRPLQNTFSMPVIYIYRDPRAVVASMMRRGGWQKGYGTLCLRDQLLQPQDGRAEFFSQWHDKILKYDGKNLAVRVAAYWAMTEKFVQHSFADGQAPIAFVGYEELCRAREKKMLDIFAQLQVGKVWAENFQALDADSAMTSKARLGASVDERIAGWKKVLSPSEAGGIESIARRFGFEDRLVDE